MRVFSCQNATILEITCRSSFMLFFQPDIFGFDSCTGCTDCNCAPASTNSQCDIDTGSCTCQPGVTGYKCHNSFFVIFYSLIPLALTAVLVVLTVTVLPPPPIPSVILTQVAVPVSQVLLVTSVTLV